MIGTLIVWLNATQTWLAQYDERTRRREHLAKKTFAMLREESGDDKGQRYLDMMTAAYYRACEIDPFDVALVCVEDKETHTLIWFYARKDEVDCNG